MSFAHGLCVLLVLANAASVTGYSLRASEALDHSETHISSKAIQLASDIKCPAPIFVAECTDSGTCFCVCASPDTCPSTAKVLDPEEAAKLFKEALNWVNNGMPYSLVQGKHASRNSDIKCPAPIFVAECTDSGTCFCVCASPDTCPSTAKVLDPEEAAKLFKEALNWVNNGMPYSLVQGKHAHASADIKCPAPIFVAECTDSGTCFCVCASPDTCPSTAKVLDPEEAAKLFKEALNWVNNGMPYSLVQGKHGSTDIKCPAPIFVAECTDSGTCFCVCASPDTCPSTAKVLDPAEAAKLFKEALNWVNNGMPYSFVQGTQRYHANALVQAKHAEADIKCPAPIFVAECTDSGTCFCVCASPDTCPSTAKVLDPEEAAKLFKEALNWVNNGMPYSLVQGKHKSTNTDIKCPAPIFVAECTDSGTCFCVCASPDTCPSTAKVLDPEEAAKLFKEALNWVNNGMPYSLVQGKHASANSDIKCPAPIFVAECTDSGTCFCVCASPDTCPSTAKVLDPEEAAKLFKEALNWVNNGMPYSLVQGKQAHTSADIKCPAPIFVAECTDSGTCFCVCASPDTCPSTAKVLDPEEAAKLFKEALNWVNNGMPYSFAQRGHKALL